MSSRPRGEAGEVCAVLVRCTHGRPQGRWMDPTNEIGIDFPSMTPALDRIRDAFFHTPAGDPDGHPLELVVARDEMGRARDIVLDVPYSVTCPTCGGRGESWGQWCDACGSCGETDIRQSVRVTIPRRVSDGARFVLRVVDRDLGLPEIAVRIKLAARAS